MLKRKNVYKYGSIFLTLIGIMIMLLNWKVCLNWIEQHSTLFSALSSVGASLSAIFAFCSIRQTFRLRAQDRIEAAKLRREDRKRFETELANAIDIANSTKQQAISMKKLATVLEKQLELLGEKKLRVTTQNSWISDDPNNILPLINVSLIITNPTKQTIKINSISIHDNSLFIFRDACHRELSYLPHSLGTLHYIYPQQEKHLCLKKPLISPPIHSNIDLFSLKPSGLLGLVISVFPIDRNSEIPLILTMEHTAVNPLNPPEKVTFCPEYFNIESNNKPSQLSRSKLFDLINNRFPT